jgi:pimeloyl-ACP methyl ester carboxylesterase
MRLMLRKPRWLKLVYFVVGFLGAYFFGCYLLARNYLSPSRVTVKKPSMASAVAIANGQYAIPLWCTPRLAAGHPGAQTVFILVHGYGGTRAGWADMFEDLNRDGFEVAMPAMPGHEENTDPTSGFGLKEAEVVAQTSVWVRHQYRSKPKIILVGVSMGGAACWLASEAHPDVADAIVTEGSFAHLNAAIDGWFDMALPAGKTILSPVRWFATRMSNIQPQNVNPVEGARKWKGKPALVINGAEDALMKRPVAEELAQAAGCELWIVPGATHAHCYDVARAQYHERLVTLARALQRADQAKGLQ